MKQPLSRLKVSLLNYGPMLGISVVLLLATMLIPAHTAEADHNIPPVSLLAEIRLAANPGWSLSILPDGSAAIGYGSHAPDFASVPAGTFDFERVYQSVAADARPSGSMRDPFTVIFYRRGATDARALRTDKADLLVGLFITARQNCDPLAKARIDELWERMPPASSLSPDAGTIAAIARDIENLKQQYPQLQEFSGQTNVHAGALAISYAYRTHRARHAGGWTAGVPNPDEEGVWFHIDFHDPASTSQLHTQPALRTPQCLGNKRVGFLILEGPRTRPLSGAIWQVLRKYGVVECHG